MGKGFSKCFKACGSKCGDNADDSFVESLTPEPEDKLICLKTSDLDRFRPRRNDDSDSPRQIEPLRDILPDESDVPQVYDDDDKSNVDQRVPQTSRAIPSLKHPEIKQGPKWIKQGTKWIKQEESDFGGDDDEGNLIVEDGDVLKLNTCRKTKDENNIDKNKWVKVRVGKRLGQGAFGQVHEVYYENRKIALKLLNNCETVKALEYEINVLETLKRKDPSGKYFCVQMLDLFTYHGHICIAFEIFGLSVKDFMEQILVEPFSIGEVRHITYQLCIAVKFLHKNHITHADLKLANILFENSDYETQTINDREITVLKNSNIKLIDFGSANFDWQESLLQGTRNYRAPEIILDLFPWSKPIDVFSVGCILFELHVGEYLFPISVNNDIAHLVMMERILGPIPCFMKQEAGNEMLDLNQLDSKLRQDILVNIKPLRNCMIKQHEEEYRQLFGLIKKTLEYNPAKRISSAEVSQHKFFDLVPHWQRHEGGTLKKN